MTLMNTKRPPAHIIIFHIDNSGSSGRGDPKMDHVRSQLGKPIQERKMRAIKLMIGDQFVYNYCYNLSL